VSARTVVVVQAHQDDADFYCGGSVARWASMGDRVIYVTVTDGSKGTLDPATDPKTLATTREQEQREAAAVLGVSECLFLGYPDGDLFPDLTVREKLVRIIRHYRPALLVTHDPTWKSYLLHNDHRVTGEMALGAAMAAGFPLYHREHLGEGLGAHTVQEVLLFQSPEPDFSQDITGYLGLKIKALLCHQSQAYLLSQAENALGVSLAQALDLFQAGASLPLGAVREKFKRLTVAEGGTIT